MSRDELEELYRRTGALVFRRCRWLLREDAAAEDAMQEVFVRVWLNRDGFKEGSVPLSWLYRTAERCCFDRMRKHKRETSEGPYELPCMRDDLRAHESRELVLGFLHKLGPKLAQLALLHYVDGLSQEEIASELSWSRRTVGKKLQLLRKKAERLAAKQGSEA